MAYWSTDDDDPPTYHVCNNCPNGKQIHPVNLKKGTPPAGREKCGTCRNYEASGACK